MFGMEGSWTCFKVGGQTEPVIDYCYRLYIVCRACILVKSYDIESDVWNVAYSHVSSSSFISPLIPRESLGMG